MLPAAAAAAVAGWWLLAEGGKADYGMRTSMAAAGAVLLLARMAAPPDQKLARPIATLLLFVWAGVTIGTMAGRDIDRLITKHEARLWSNYHYYLGAKYFTELGYRDLYDQTIAVDLENEQVLDGIPSIRDLRTYQREPMNYFSRLRSDAWTGDRWDDFSADVRFFLPKFDKGDWRRILRDRGYNATPAGNTIYWLLSRFELSDPALALLGALDPLLLLLAFVVVGRVFGSLKAILGAAWFLLYFGNEFHVVGGPLQYDYMVALLLMACAVHRNRPMSAGLLLGYACMTRVFPGFLLAGLAIWTVVAMRRDRGFPKFTNRFARGLLTSVAVLFVVGCLNGRGVHAWTEWADNISLHSEHHRFGDKRIGMQHVFTHDWSLDWGEWRLKEWRRRTWPNQKNAWAAAATALILLWGAAAWRGAREERDPLDSLVFAMAVSFAAIVVSRYYWGAAALFFLLGGRERDGPREGLIGASLLALVAGFYVLQGTTESSYGQYAMANLLILGWFVAVLAGRLVRPTAALPSTSEHEGSLQGAPDQERGPQEADLGPGA